MNRTTRVFASTVVLGVMLAARAQASEADSGAEPPADATMTPVTKSTVAPQPAPPPKVTRWPRTPSGVEVAGMAVVGTGSLTSAGFTIARLGAIQGGDFVLGAAGIMIFGLLEFSVVLTSALPVVGPFLMAAFFHDSTFTFIGLAQCGAVLLTAAVALLTDSPASRVQVGVVPSRGGTRATFTVTF